MQINIETLNIREATIQLTVIALNKYRFFSAAAAALGISARTLRKYRKDFNIKKDLTRHYYTTTKQ